MKAEVKVKSHTSKDKLHYILFLNRFVIYKKGSLSAAFYGGDGGNRNRVRNLILTNFYERIRLFKIPSAHRPTAVYALW